MNFSVLDFFEFASRMPQTAQILVSTFKIFQGACPRTPLDISSFFFSFFFKAILRIWVLKFLFFSTLTQSDFLLVVADRLKSMLYLYQNICCCCTRTGLLKMFDLMAQLRSAPRLLWRIFTPIKEFYGTNTHANTNNFKTPNKQYFGFAIYSKTKNINSLTLGNS